MEITSFKQIFWDKLRQMTWETSRMFSCSASRMGLTVLQVGILMEVDRLGSVSIGALGKNLSIAGGNISNVCKRLEQMGYLSRERSQQDERVVMVSLTEQGKQLLEDNINALEARIEAVMKQEPQENMDDILRGLQKMNELFDRLKAAHEEELKGGNLE